MRHDAAILTILGTAHLLVDACCAAAAYRMVVLDGLGAETFVALLLLYHVLAFGLQPMAGLAVDALNASRLASVVGCLLTVAALAMTPYAIPVITIVIAGLGNALFHVGGGAICLRLSPHRAAIPGLFVAPGSIGLLLGCILGRLYPQALLPLGITTAIACLPMVVFPRRLECSESSSVSADSRQGVLSRPADIILGLILLSIGVRALLGFLVAFSWDTRPWTLITLVVATCLGKACGGFAADRWGWRRVGVGVTLASLPLLAASRAMPEAAIPGLFLLNMTMPITLIAVAESLPGRPGFAFGLPCLALLLGAMPSLVGLPIGGPWIVVAVLLVSAASLYRGLGASETFSPKTVQVNA